MVIFSLAVQLVWNKMYMLLGNPFHLTFRIEGEPIPSR